MTEQEFIDKLIDGFRDFYSYYGFIGNKLDRLFDRIRNVKYVGEPLRVRNKSLKGIDSNICIMFHRYYENAVIDLHYIDVIKVKYDNVIYTLSEGLKKFVADTNKFIVYTASMLESNLYKITYVSESGFERYFDKKAEAIYYWIKYSTSRLNHSPNNKGLLSLSNRLNAGFLKYINDDFIINKPLLYAFRNKITFRPDLDNSYTYVNNNIDIGGYAIRENRLYEILTHEGAHIMHLHLSRFKDIAEMIPNLSYNIYRDSFEEAANVYRYHRPKIILLNKIVRTTRYKWSNIHFINHKLQKLVALLNLKPISSETES